MKRNDHTRDETEDDCTNSNSQNSTYPFHSIQGSPWHSRGLLSRSSAGALDVGSALRFSP